MGLLNICLHALLLFVTVGKKFKGRDFYKILGLTRSQANKPQAIKKAYKKMAMVWHPDKNPDNKEEANKKFVDIGAAYETLSDPEKKRRYDQVGEEDPSKNGGGGGGQQDMWDTFFHQGGGHGGWHGGHGGGERHIFQGTEVDEWGAQEYDEMVSAPDVGQFTAVVFYKSGATQGLRDAVLDVHRAYSSIGLTVAAINCGLMPGVCNKENISDGKSRLMLFWKDGDKKTLERKKFFIGNSSGKQLNKWVSTALPDVSANLKTLEELKAWSKQENAGKVVLFTDKTKAPPLIKIFGAKFVPKVEIGIVYVDKQGILNNEIAKHFGAEKTPSLLFISDRSATKGEFFTSRFENKFLDMFFSRVKHNHLKEANAAKARELTKASYKSGTCAKAVSHFCLIYMEQPSEKRMGELNDVAVKLKDDHVKVFWLNPDNLSALADEFGNHLVVLWRPKRMKWKAYEAGISNNDTAFGENITSWVSNTVNGGAQLPNKISGKFYRDEL